MVRWFLCCALVVPLAAFAQSGGVGFRTVADALAAVKTRPGAKLTQPDGWTVITEQGGSVVWSFTPAGHPAHPAVVRRSIDVGDDGVPRVEMGVLCQGDKPACDALAKSFQTINERAMRPLRERMKTADEVKQR